MNPGFSTLLAITMLFTPQGQENKSPSAGFRIIFFGDSITEQGDEPGGYVSLVRDSLQREPKGSSPEIIAAGVSGDRVPDLLDRLDRDVLVRHPSVVVVYIGINDVWHSTHVFGGGTPKKEYLRGLRTLVQRITAGGARVLLCTPSVIGECHDGTNALDPMLEEYSAISRSVATGLGASLCDLRRLFVEHLKQKNPQNRESGILTTDSVHLNGAGNEFVARQILKSLRESNLISPLD